MAAEAAARAERDALEKAKATERANSRIIEEQNSRPTSKVLIDSSKQTKQVKIDVTRDYNCKFGNGDG